MSTTQARPAPLRRQVFEPHRAGLPAVGPYARELWRRREFAVELSKSTMRAAQSMTFFGRLWLVLNPLLLALVYYLLVVVLTGGGSNAELGRGYFVYLVSGLFTFYFVAGSMSAGAASVVGGGKLIMNQAFPRLLLPFSAVRTAFRRFLPTLIVFLFFFTAFWWAGTRAEGPQALHFGWAQLLGIPALGLIVVFSAGLAALFATLQVYFRDTTSFLPYFNRIWLYASPVLYTPEMLVRRLPESLEPFVWLNPMYPLLGVWNEAVVEARVPSPSLWAGAVAWALIAIVGGSLFLMSREREFAVRL